jgi:hypothetical protein
MSAKSATKFCKVCFDAGKSEKEYTNHYVRRDREPNSPVVCPTLLNQECGFCGKLGHSPKYCTVLEDKKKQDAKKEKALKKQQYQEQKQQQQKPAVAAAKVTKPTASNVFAALYDDSDDEEPKPKPAAASAVPALKKDQFPALQQQEQQQSAKAPTKKPAAANAWLKSLQQSCPNLTVPKQMAAETYVNSAAVPKATLVRPKQEEAQAQACPQPIFVSDFLEEAEEAFAPPPRQKASQMNWAELEDPDSDDEDW